MNLKDITKITKIPVKVLKREMKRKGHSVKNQKQVLELLETCLSLIAQKELRNNQQ